jgi:hypothetical protein
MRLAEITLAGGVAAAAASCAAAKTADARGGATALPAIEVSAPERREAIRMKKPAGGGARTGRTAAVGIGAVTDSGWNPNAFAQAPVKSASEKNVSGADVNARPLSRPA